jgi:hypothetical protein
MCSMKVDALTRRWFLGPALMLWIGIYLTGFDRVHWLIYLPAVLSVFALATGLCPGRYMICRRNAWFARKKGDANA